LEQVIGEISQMRDLLVILQKSYRISLEKKEIAPPAVQPKNGSNESESNTAANSDQENENSPEREQRLQVLRSQQAAAQMTKSEGELRGIEREIHQINQELINNRIESIDRRTRLEDKIRKPLLIVLDQSWPPLALDVHSIKSCFPVRSSLTQASASCFLVRSPKLMRSSPL